MTDETDWETCPECQGQGLDHTGNECGACNGIGEIVPDFPDESPFTDTDEDACTASDAEERPCPKMIDAPQPQEMQGRHRLNRKASPKSS